MRKISTIICVILLALTPLKSFSATIDTLELKLFDLPDVVFKQLPTFGSFKQVFELKVKQPVDHKDTTKGYFYQRVILSHAGFDRPVVLLTEGYHIWNQTVVTELASMLHANQVDVEHRYFGESTPTPKDYKYLTTEQEAADLHHINQLLREIYKGKWVSTGISKSGVTSIFYKYFYPNDVAVSVPYVAPINKEQFDKRIFNFLDTMGTNQCREKMYEMQVYLLKHRSEVMPLLEMYVKGARLKFTTLTLDKAFEYMVLEYPFTHWQFGQACDAIPDTTSITTPKALDFMLDNSGITSYDDKGINTFLSHYYQAATEMGYYGYKTTKFQGLLKALTTKPYPTAAILPDTIPAKFDGALLAKVNKWLATDGNKMIYIYGANDTWTACAVPPSKKVDAVWFFLEGKSHGNANISNMTDEQRKKLKQTLEKWLDIEIN